MSLNKVDLDNEIRLACIIHIHSSYSAIIACNLLLGISRDDIISLKTGKKAHTVY